jgi:hypothetical protein
MSFERKIALESKSKVKSFWNYINGKLKTRSGIERSDGTIASSEADKVEVLNKFFISVFTLAFFENRRRNDCLFPLSWNVAFFDRLIKKQV